MGRNTHRLTDRVGSVETVIAVAIVERLIAEGDPCLVKIGMPLHGCRHMNRLCKIKVATKQRLFRIKKLGCPDLEDAFDC